MYNRYLFFKNHAGYIVGKKALCALNLAKSEALAEANSNRVRFEWQYDDSGDRGPEDWGWPEKEIKRFWESDHYVEGCVLYIDDEPTESLWGIWDADTSYRRVIEAELFSQYLSNPSGDHVQIAPNCYGSPQLELPIKLMIGKGKQYVS